MAPRRALLTAEMAARRVVVDGSNIATEGSTLPSLKQLNEAVLAFLTEYPDTEVTVVVDATFGHRIDPTELAEFEEAEANAELVSPPAGAIGRGDAFLLRIAGKIGAMVLSNDSFQEFHGEHEWLFDEGRLIGGKPVPGIGWIFTPRTPVRGIKSRKADKDAKKKTKAPALAAAPTTSGEELGPRPVPTKPPPRRKDKTEADGAAGGGARPGKRDTDRVAAAIATATEESVDGGLGGARKRRRRKRGGRPAEPVNEALPFITFIAEHPLGSTVEGEVETFTSHGAFVLAGGARCYVPISALGDPPPRAARDVLNRGEHRQFVVQALDPQRRGIELALPEFAKVAGAPLPETIEAEILEAPAEQPVAPRPIVTPRPALPPRSRAGRRPAQPSADEALPEVPAAPVVAPPAEPVAVPAKPARKRGGAVVPSPAPVEVAGAAPAEAPPTALAPARRNPAKEAKEAGASPATRRRASSGGGAEPAGPAAPAAPAAKPAKASKSAKATKTVVAKTKPAPSKAATARSAPEPKPKPAAAAAPESAAKAPAKKAASKAVAAAAKAPKGGAAAGAAKTPKAAKTSKTAKAPKSATPADS